MCSSQLASSRKILQDFPVPTHIYQCSKCFHVSITPFPTINYLNSLYEMKNKLVYSPDFIQINLSDEVSNENKIQMETFIGQVLLKYPKGVVLDFGCGHGDLVDTLLANKWEAYGVDIAKFRNGDNFYGSLGQITNIFKFDYVILQDVIEHLADPRAQILEIASRLKDDGFLFISFPTSSSLEFRVLKEHWGMISYYTHLHFFSNESVRKFLSEVGFDIISLHIRRKPTNWFREFKTLFRLFCSIPYSVIRLKGFEHLKYRTDNLFLLLLFCVSRGDQMDIICKRKTT